MSAPGTIEVAPVDTARPRWPLAVGGAAYVSIAIATYADVLRVSVARGTTCACNDTSLFAWFFEWPLVAITHGHNPFFSSAMFHPMGINLLSNTSVTFWSFLLLPLTAALGPIASLNVALIAAPACSGFAAMWVARRWVRSDAAAFIAGALYAFSPIVLVQSAGAHLMVTSLVVPPLVLACLDELFWRRRRNPIAVGAALGGLLVVQFFMGTEMLVMLLVATGISLVVLLVAALALDRGAATAALRAGAPGALVALGIATVVLAWPTAYALAGPGHYVGPVWPGIVPAQASLRSYLMAGYSGTALWWAPTSGRFMRPTYLGPPLVATMVVGLVWLRSCRRLWAAVAMSAVVAWLALGQRYAFGAWHILRHLPILSNVMNERFAALLFLPAGLALAIVLDQVLRRRRDAVGIVLATAIAAACVAPFVLDAANGLPYRASRVWEPRWYAANAERLPSDAVVLGFPFFNTSADLLSVQALHSMRYAVVGGTGPEWVAARQGAEAPGYLVVQQVASTVAGPHLGAVATPSEARALLAALRGWHATLVVVPTARGPNTSGAARDPAAIARWLTSVLGPPRTQDAAWVWHLHARSAHR